MCVHGYISLFSRVQPFETPWTVALQAPLSIGFPRQEHWSGLPCPPPRDPPDSGIRPTSLTSPALVSQSVSSVAPSCLTLQPHESQHARPSCPSPSPRVHSHSHPLTRWCHPAISVIPFPPCPQSLPASESFPMSQLYAWGRRVLYH